jgi:indolepyruvate ferredoxin oxidoreductase, beta subunit
MKEQKGPFNLVICGVGGQGNILLSRMIGSMLNRKGYLVNIGETFGAAQRGGSVFSSVRISKEKGYGPLIPEGRAHVILSLEPLEALRMLTVFGNPEVKTLTNTEPIYPVGVLSKRLQYPDSEKLRQAIKRLSGVSLFLNATELALELEAPIAVNIVMLGGLVGIQVIPITREDVAKEIRSRFPAGKVDINLEALQAGIDAAGPT